MTILGLSGKLQSGKDTTADYIRELLAEWNVSMMFAKVGFADALYEEVAKATAISPYMLTSLGLECQIKYIKENKSHFRKILQGWGTDYRRELCGTDYWIKRLLEKVRSIDDNTFVVIPDIRFKNEKNTLVEIDTPIWRLVRPSSTNENSSHQSETELKDEDGWDSVIVNDGSLVKLKTEVRTQLSLLLRKKGIVR